MHMSTRLGIQPHKHTWIRTHEYLSIAIINDTNHQSDSTQSRHGTYESSNSQRFLNRFLSRSQLIRDFKIVVRKLPGCERATTASEAARLGDSWESYWCDIWVKRIFRYAVKREGGIWGKLIVQILQKSFFRFELLFFRKFAHST